MLIINANNGAKIVNLPLAVVDMFFEIFTFDFRFRQEEKVKFGPPFCKYFLTINDLYNGENNFEFTCTSCGCSDMIFLNIKLWLPVWTESKGQIGVTFLSIFFDN